MDEGRSSPAVSLFNETGQRHNGIFDISDTRVVLIQAVQLPALTIVSA
jgi:hypothetical protein